MDYGAGMLSDWIKRVSQEPVDQVQRMRKDDQLYWEMKDRIAQMQERAQMAPVERGYKQSLINQTDANTRSVNRATDYKNLTETPETAGAAVEEALMKPQETALGIGRKQYELMDAASKRALQEMTDDFNQRFSRAKSDDEKLAIQKSMPAGFWDWYKLQEEAKRARINASSGGSGQISDYKDAFNKVKSDPLWKDKSNTEIMGEASRLLAGKSANAYATDQITYIRTPEGKIIAGKAVEKTNAATGGSQGQGNQGWSATRVK